ncbi:MAG: acyloxyacyl hydrolase [Bacteroidia bacterium]|nr:acyloxyacyl hydrolase [Bacteroidia bacterium]
MKKWVFICNLFLILNSNAQNFRGFQVNLLPGFLIAHREYMANMEAHTYGLEFIYSSNFSGWKSMDEHYRNLMWGTGLTYFNLGHKDLNGHVLAWHIHVEAALKKKSKSLTTFRFGSGIGYISRPYNLQSNKKNKAIGSNLNGNMQLLLKHYIDVSKKSSLILGIGVTHYSNGNFKRPNLGINMAHLDIGLLRKVNFVDPITKRELKNLFPENGFEFNIGYARKQIAVADTRFFNIYSTSLLYYFKHNNTRHWRAGTEIFFDKTYPYQLFNEASLKNKNLSEFTEIAVKIGHEFQFGRIAVVTDLGTYAYRPNDYKKRVYFSIGFNYCLGNNLIAQTRLKSHMAVADFFYWSAGYRFSDQFLRK